MKKLIFLLLIISSCKKEVYYYPSKSFFDENKPTEIIVNNMSFQEVTDAVRNGLYNDTFFFIKIEDCSKVYNVIPFARTGGYKRMRNGLYIRNDSLDLINGKYPLRDLSKYLKLHYENNDKEYFYASSYKRAYIQIIKGKNEKYEKVIPLLLKVVKTFNNTSIKFKDSIQFNIILDYPLESIYPNPPAPSSIEIED